MRRQLSLSYDRGPAVELAAARRARKHAVVAAVVALQASAPNKRREIFSRLCVFKQGGQFNLLSIN